MPKTNAPRNRPPRKSSAQGAAKTRAAKAHTPEPRAPKRRSLAASPPRDMPPEVSRMLAILKTGGDARPRKVRRIKAAIKVASYENDLKLQIAIDRMSREMEEAV